LGQLNPLWMWALNETDIGGENRSEQELRSTYHRAAGNAAAYDLAGGHPVGGERVGGHPRYRSETGRWSAAAAGYCWEEQQ
jgi:hypothetical protein